MELKTAGIYVISNKENGKKYVGQSSDLRMRWIHHRWFLKNNKHHNRHLQAAWNKYGEDAFEFFILEYCHKDILDEREQYYIWLCNSYNFGYNLDYGGDGIRGYSHTQEEINKMRRIQEPPVVLQFDLDFNFIKRWPGGASHISKEKGKSWTRSSIITRCRHVGSKMSPYKGFYWVYEDEYKSDKFTWEAYLQNIPAVNIGDICKIKTTHVVYQYTLSGEYVAEWNDLNDLLNQQFDIDRIRMICHHTNNLKQHKGYIWVFDKNDIHHEYFQDIINQSRGSIRKSLNVRPVVMLDDNNNVICQYESIRDASYNLVGNAGLVSSISRVCSGQAKLAYQHKWKYA